MFSFKPHTLEKNHNGIQRYYFRFDNGTHALVSSNIRPEFPLCPWFVLSYKHTITNQLKEEGDNLSLHEVNKILNYLSRCK